METREENLVQNVNQFLNIHMNNGVPYLYLRYNEETSKHEWLCLETPDKPRMIWEKGRKWCKSKGGDYGDIFTLGFISERFSEINQVLEAKGYPLIECEGHWSAEGDSNDSEVVHMYDGSINYIYKYNDCYVRCVVSK